MSEISCQEVLRQIELFIDGELGPDQAAHLASHLGRCNPCADLAAFQRRLKEILRTKCRSATPEHLLLQIRAALRAEGPGPRAG